MTSAQLDESKHLDLNNIIQEESAWWNFFDSVGQNIQAINKFQVKEKDDQATLFQDILSYASE